MQVWKWQMPIGKWRLPVWKWGMQVWNRRMPTGKWRLPIWNNQWPRLPLLEEGMNILDAVFASFSDLQQPIANLEHRSAISP
jgi:hypothetical protein